MCVHAYVVCVCERDVHVWIIQVLLSNTNDSIDYQSFVCTLLNGFKYFYQTPIILFNISQLFAHSEMISNIAKG